MPHQQEDPRNLIIVAVGLGSVVTLSATMYGLYSYYSHMRTEMQQERIFGRANPELIESRKEEDRRLTSYAALDPAKKNIRIPVDQAMALLAKRGRDGVPSIKPNPDSVYVGGAPPPPPVASAPPPPPEEKKDEKKDDKDKKDKDKKDKDKKDKKDKK